MKQDHRNVDENHSSSIVHQLELDLFDGPVTVLEYFFFSDFENRYEKKTFEALSIFTDVTVYRKLLTPMQVKVVMTTANVRLNCMRGVLVKHQAVSTMTRVRVPPPSRQRGVCRTS